MAENSSNALPSKVAAPSAGRAASAQQQLDAARRAQDQAEQRVKLGVQLFKAAEAHVANHQELVSSVRAEQKELQQKLQEDVARSFQQYDRWVSEVDEGLTDRLHELEGKLDQLQQQWTETEKRIDGLMHRAEAMFDQSRNLLDTAPPQTRRVDAPTARTSEPAAPRNSERATQQPNTEPLRALPPHEPIYLNLVNKMRDSAA